MTFEEALKQFHYIAILRGIKPGEVIKVADVLFSAGFRIIEVPTNSPDAFESIALLQQHFDGECLIGAGTVVELDHVDNLAKTGADLCIAPNVDEDIIRKAKSLDLTMVPGFMTPSEAYTAVNAGADALKAFPCNLIDPGSLKAMMAILPKNVPIIPVGGIDHKNTQAYLDVGAAGFGLGSSLYKPGDTPEIVKQKAATFI